MSKRIILWRDEYLLIDQYGDEITLWVNDEYPISVEEFTRFLSYLKAGEVSRSPYGAAFEAVTLAE